MEARERKVINKSGLLGGTVTADYGHSSAYHTLRLDDRFSMMGVLEIWKKERTSGNAFVVITKRVKSLIINPSGWGIEDDKGSVLEKVIQSSAGYAPSVEETSSTHRFVERPT